MQTPLGGNSEKMSLSSLPSCLHLTPCAFHSRLLSSTPGRGMTDSHPRLLQSGRCCCVLLLFYSQRRIRLSTACLNALTSILACLHSSSLKLYCLCLHCGASRVTQFYRRILSFPNTEVQHLSSLQAYSKDKLMKDTVTFINFAIQKE